jgi:SEC-C motif-containing protein
MKSLEATAPCPCGRTSSAAGHQGEPLAFGACCGKYLNGHALNGPFPEDAHTLMRSRYTAFVLERADYLLATWDITRRPDKIEFEDGVKWLGLEVRSLRTLDEFRAEVEFIARQKPALGAAVRLHERSRFVRSGVHWQYVDGDAL